MHLDKVVMDLGRAANTSSRTLDGKAWIEPVRPTGSGPRAVRPRACVGNWLLLAAVIAALLGGCVPVQPAQPSVQGSSTSATGARFAIYAPATTSSVPVILAVRQMPEAANTHLTIFTNQSQASTLFLRGDVDVLVSGLAVGVQFFNNGAPVQVANCYVSGLTYLVMYGEPVSDFGQLKGQSLYVPFEGSPIEEISQYFAQRAGLQWKQDVKPVYAPFDSSLALLKQGKARAVVLPEPYATLAEQEPQVHVALGYRAMWDALTGSTDGYPQVCTFVRKPWAGAHPGALAQFNSELARAIQLTQRDPAAAAQTTAASLGLPEDVLLSSLRRTDLAFQSGGAMAQQVRRYYQIVGKPLGASYDTFFYLRLDGGSQ